MEISAKIMIVFSLVAIILTTNGCALTEREVATSPNHPPLYDFGYELYNLGPGDHRLSLTMIDNTNNFQPGIEVERHYIVYIPTRFNPYKSYDLVFHFHGATGSSEYSFEQTRISAEADRRNFIVILPQGMGKSVDGLSEDIFNGDENFQNKRTGWNTRPDLEPNDAISYATERHPDDDTFINNIISLFEGSLTINNIYVTGFSNGCGMAQHIAYTRDDIDGMGIGGCGLVGGDFLNYQQDVENEIREPFPILIFHGTNDSTSEYLHIGQEIRPGEPITAELAIEAFAGVNECDENPLIQNFQIIDDPDVESTDRWTYSNCEASTQFFKLIGGQHEWYPQMTPPVINFLYGRSSNDYFFN